MREKTIRFDINGESYVLTVPVERTLLELLRDDLHLTGTKCGCDTGECGSCTVIIDERPFRSCLTLAVDVQDRRITTIEGLATGTELHPVQRAFIEKQAIQCGFCSPGMILTAKAFLNENPKPTREEVRRGLAGNICRCTGYQKIVEAVLSAADEGGEK